MSNRRFYKYPSAATISARKGDLFAAHPGLEAALKSSHRIVQDIRQRLDTWGKLSDPQIALVIKLAADAAQRQAQRDAEIKIPAPEGRIEFTGRIVSCKYREPYHAYGEGTYKLTVKVESDAGVWLVWCTAPQALFDAQSRRRQAIECAIEQGDASLGHKPSAELVGATVTLQATLAQGNEPHFAIGKRPTFRDIVWGGALAQAPKSEALAA